MYAENVRTTLFVRIPTAFLAIALAFAPPIFAQASENKSPCHPIGHKRFVRESFEYAKDAARVPDTLHVLSCIARSNRGGLNLNTSAVRAGFVIADRNDISGQFLLSVMQDSATPAAAHMLACELIRYVADPDTEAAMFQSFRDTWPSQHSVMFFEYFRAMGNIEFLAWADEQLATDTQVSYPKERLKVQAELVRVQQDRERVLQYITSPENPILFRVWLTRHALRCGLSRVELRRVFLPMFEQQSPSGKERIRHSQLVEALDELRVFGEEDVAVLKHLRDVQDRYSIWPADPAPRWFEEYVAPKRAAFLRVTDN